jgi:hypothetical protein
MTRGTFSAQELAGVLGVSTWLIYQSVKEGTCPVPPIWVGKRLLFSRAKTYELLDAQTGEHQDRPSMGSQHGVDCEPRSLRVLVSGKESTTATKHTSSEERASGGNQRPSETNAISAQPGHESEVVG